VRLEEVIVAQMLATLSAACDIASKLLQGIANTLLFAT